MEAPSSSSGSISGGASTAGATAAGAVGDSGAPSRGDDSSASSIFGGASSTGGMLSSIKFGGGSGGDAAKEASPSIFAAPSCAGEAILGAPESQGKRRVEGLHMRVKWSCSHQAGKQSQRSWPKGKLSAQGGQSEAVTRSQHLLHRMRRMQRVLRWRSR